MSKRSPFRYFKTSPEVIRLAVMLYVRFPLSLRSVEDLLHERDIKVSHEAVRFWWQGGVFAGTGGGLGVVLGLGKRRAGLRPGSACRG